MVFTKNCVIRLAIKSKQVACQFGELGTLSLVEGDVPGDVLIPALAREHATHERDLGPGSKFG